MPKSIKNTIQNSIDIEKSEFITILYHVTDVGEAKDIIKNIKKEYNDATHVVYAYIIKGISHSTDDGEPSGTAGIPTLEVLKKNDLSDILAVTIRYFGGIKLGAGGLLRAYSRGVSEVLINAEYMEEIETVNFELVFEYKAMSYVDKKLYNALDVIKKFDENVHYIITLKLEDYPKFIDDLSPLGMTYLIKNEIYEKRYI